MILLHSEKCPNTYYEKLGNGYPLILIHGFAEDHTIWQHQVDALAKFNLLIIPDLPGTGFSSLPNEHMSMELMAECIHDIFLQEKIEQAIVCGHSMGGYIALAFAEKYPDKIKALGLIHSSSYADDEEKKTNRRKAIKLLENNEQGQQVFLQAMIPNLYAEDFRENNKVILEDHLTMATKIPSSHLIAYYQAMIERPDRMNILREIKKPVLFVIGEKDNAIPLQSSLTQCHVPDISRVEILREVGHASMNEAPERLNDILNSFTNYVLEQ